MLQSTARFALNLLKPTLHYSLLVALLLPGVTYAGTADLTRFLGEYERGPGRQAMQLDEFRASAGPARLIVTPGPGSGASARALIFVNGEKVFTPGDFRTGAASVERRIELADENTVSVLLRGRPGSGFTLRVKQEVDVDLNITGRIHFNTQVSDFAASKLFYQDLGFVNAFAFPRTNTLEVAEAIGVETPTIYDGSEGPEAGGYLLQVELLALATFAGSFIDLIEFTIPRNEDPPYPFLYHLGMARAALQTVDLDADYNYLVSLGVEFLSPPVARASGQRFAIFKDPDGTFYELTEVEGEAIPGSVSNIVSVGRVNINVSDFERSKAFYELLDFGAGEALPVSESLDVARAFGLASPFTQRGELLAHIGDGSGIELLEWIQPRDASPPYPLPVNHIGIHRVAYSTDDLTADVAALKAVGIEFLTDIAPCCEGPDSASGIISFLDPDGTVFELVGPITSP